MGREERLIACMKSVVSELFGQEVIAIINAFVSRAMVRPHPIPKLAASAQTSRRCFRSEASTSERPAKS